MDDISFRLQDIGNTIRLRDEIDKDSKVTNWFRQGLNIVDLYPAHFRIDLATFDFKVYNIGKGGDEGFYYDPTVKFRNRCLAYKLREATALRLWITGESTFQEELSSEYETNLVESGINGAVASLGPGFKLIKQLTTGTGLKFADVLGKKQLLETTKSLSDSTVDSLIPKDGTGLNADVKTNISNALHKISNKLISFSYVSMPKTYAGTSYDPALNFNVRLISPYGHPNAIQKFIVEPLTYLLLLSTPTTTDGLTYGGSSYVTVKAYGIASINLATVTNISIRRGGNDVSYNKYRQPLSIDVNISLKPAATGFAAYLNKDQTEMNSNEIPQPNGASDVAIVPADSSKVDSDGFLHSTQVDFDSNDAHSPMTTVGDILQSFRPMPVFETANKDAAAAFAASPPITPTTTGRPIATSNPESSYAVSRRLMREQTRLTIDRARKSGKGG